MTKNSLLVVGPDAKGSGSRPKRRLCWLLCPVPCSARYRTVPGSALVLGLVVGLLSGCAEKRINFEPKPNNPIYQEKKEFYDDYFRLVTEDEKRYGYPDLSEPIRPFGEIDNSDEFSRFKENFWNIRDTDPYTSQNEFKELIDSRIRDIKNDIFATDLNIPGTYFSTDGGLRGDLAHVYLLWGKPHLKEKIPESQIVFRSELMVWYYFFDNKVLARFLFYNNYGRTRLFKEHTLVLNFEILTDPISSPLISISSKMTPTREELIDIWYDLERNDPEGLFRSALFEFSDYINLDKGTRWTIDTALKAPEPVAMVAERFKPTILGQPDIPEGTELFESGYSSFLPAYVRTNVGPDNPTFLMVVILRKNVDWVKQNNQGKIYAANLNFRISFQNKKTLRLTEFMSYYKFELSQKEFDKRDDKGNLIGNVVAFPLAMSYFDGENLGPTLREMMKQLESGEYVVNMYLQHTLTMKYNALREEIVIK